MNKPMIKKTKFDKNSFTIIEISVKLKFFMKFI